MSLEIKTKEDIKPGYWYSRCCHHDLYVVEEDDVEPLYDDFIDGFPPDIWETKLDALHEIRERWDDEDELKMIDEMIKMEEV